MSVAPHAGVVDFGTFTPPTASLNGIQGEVPQPLIGQENYVLTGNGWSSLGALGALTYQGTWDASTNTPTLVSSVGVQGYYYVVSVAGNTDLNGITTWDVGDWAIFNGSAWQKIEGGTVGTFTNVITPQVTARTDNLTLSAISTGTVTINTASANNTFLLVKDDTTAAASTTGLTVLGASSGLGRLALRSNKALYVASGSSNNISFLTNSGVVSEGSTQMLVGHTTSAVNYVQVTGAATGSSPTISMQGSDSLIALGIRAKGNGDIFFQNNASAGTSLVLSGVTSGVNYHQLTNSAAGLAPTYRMVGTDTNISMAFQPKGTGAIDLAAGSSGVNISNGGTVTAITRTAGGNSYTTAITGTISAPTTAGGVQATMSAGVGAITQAIAGGGTGYTVGNVLNVVGGTIINSSLQQIRVDAVSGGVITAISVAGFGQYTVLPTNPVSVTGGSGSGATFNLSNWSFTGSTITNAGSGYIEQPTITFSGGGGSGAAAYAVVGGVTTIRGLGSSSPGNIANSILFNTPSGTSFSIVDRAAVAVNYASAIGNVTTQPAIIRGLGSDTNVGLNLGTQGTGTITFSTSTTSSNVQFVVNHIASSVNYLQATGSATGNATGPILSAQGSDTNIPIQIQGKGTGSVAVLTPTTLGGTTGNTAELFAAKGSNSNSIWLRASQYRNATGTDWQTASLRLGMRIDTTDMSYIEFNPSGFPQGIAIQTANNQPINFNTSGAQFRVGVASSSVNYIQAVGGATTKTPILSAQGSDTNISLGFQSKGTGAINLAAGSSGVNISNGGTVTAITRTATGSGYSSAPTVTIDPPTTVGGVQATAQVSGYGTTAGTVVSGGTGYAVGNVITVNAGGSGGIYTVTGVTGGVVTSVATTGNGGTYPTIPTNPVATTGGTGTGLTLNLSNFYVVGFSILTAGSGYIEQPAVTVTGGGAGVNAAAYVNVGGTTTVKSLGNTMNFYTANSNIGLQVYDATGVGTGYWKFGAGYSTSAVMLSNGANAQISTGGAGNLSLQTNTAATTQAVIAHTASAVNYVQVTGAATGGQPTISAQGSDTNIGFKFRTKGVFNHEFQNGNSNNGLVINMTSGTTLANYVEVAPKITGTSPTISVLGTDTNISLNLVTKGTGTVQQNGNPLAQVNHKYHAFTVGAYYYDSYEQTNFFRLFSQNAAADTIRYGAVNTPEYYDYGTSTWTAWAAGLTGIQNLLDGNPNTGMDVAHANRTFRFVVTNSDGWPTNALVMLQSTWSAVTYTTATVTIASGTAVGGPFTTRQVMTFSPANTGNNWGLHAYYTGSIHTGEGFYQITIDLTDWVDVSTYTTYPLRNLNIFSNYSTVAGRILPFSNVYDKTSVFIGGIRTATDANGVLDIGRYSSVDPTSYIDSGSNATRIIFRTQYTAQLRIAHTASAVNYVQLTGGSTGNGVVFSAEGSDANINTFITSKGASSVVMQTNSRENFRVADGGTSVVNNLQAVGSNTGLAAILQARGSDTNIDISFVPKGTGRVKYGTHTATADAPITGYIEIVDSGGTIRKLAVIT